MTQMDADGEKEQHRPLIESSAQGRASTASLAFHLSSYSLECCFAQKILAHAAIFSS